MGGIKDAYEILVEKSEGHLGDLDIDRRVRFKWE
jgi:hypothetical protein